MLVELKGLRVFKPGLSFFIIFFKKYNSFITFYNCIVQIFIILLGLISYNVFDQIYLLLFM